MKEIVKKNKDAADDAAAINSAVADKTVDPPTSDLFKNRTAHIARVSKYLKKQELALATAEREFQEKRAKAATALHAKM